MTLNPGHLTAAVQRRVAAWMLASTNCCCGLTPSSLYPQDLVPHAGLTQHLKILQCLSGDATHATQMLAHDVTTTEQMTPVFSL